MTLWHRWVSRALLILGLGLLASQLLRASEPLADEGDVSTVPQVWVIPLTGAIGPATTELVLRHMQQAAQARTELIVLEMDTPGGLDTSMRELIKAILASPIPVATYVSPPGARAASAGTYILYASHIAAMAPATNLGAATPVAIGPTPGQPGDQPQTDPGSSDDDDADNGGGQAPSNRDALRNKQVNDAIAYIRGLAELRDRNVEWAEKSVLEAASLPAEEALAEGVIDLIATDLDDLLTQVNGKTVKVGKKDFVIETDGTRIVRIEPDWRNEILAVITNPNVAYMLLMIGFYGLILEFYSPGLGLPGILGAICLLLGFYALHLLPISYAGLGLMLLGLALMVTEALMPSFGVFGIGGVCAFVIGSLLLMETDTPSFQIALPLVAGIAFVSLLFFGWVLRSAVRVRRKRVVTGSRIMLGQVVNIDQRYLEQGLVEVGGELWHAQSSQALVPGSLAIIKAVDGLTLTLEPEKKQ